MTRKRRNVPVSSKGYAWGRRRVELDVSLRELSKLTGVSTHDLSRIESGRMIATGEEYAKVTAALDGVAAEDAAVGEPLAAAEPV